MRYRRLGAGRPVVLLSSDSPGEAIWPEALAAIAALHRVYAPELQADQPGIGPWLRDFMDGVGADRPAIIATSSYCIPALEYALADPYRLHSLVLIPDGAVAETGLDGIIGTGNGAATLPILVTRREHPAGAATGLLTRFLHRPVQR
jgi:hypothetical protein